MKRGKRILSLLLVLCMAVSMVPANAAVLGEEVMSSPSQTVKPSEEKEALIKEIEDPGVDLKQEGLASSIAPSVHEENEMVSAIVVLKGEGLLEQGHSAQDVAAFSADIARETQRLENRQDRVFRQIVDLTEKAFPSASVASVGGGESRVSLNYHYTVGLNGMSVDLPYGVLNDVRELPEVESAFVAPVYTVPEDQLSGTTGDSTHMFNTKDYFGSAATWDVGYKGQGMTIAIVDTGLDMDHPSFQDAPENPSITAESFSEELVESLNAYTRFSKTSPAPLTADKLYRSAKVPYAFNYADSSLDVTHDNDNQGDHGTHVAGISAANEMDGTPVVGVAPEAQLFVMKVFGKTAGGADGSDVLAAVEDCIKLGVDVVNLSLGTPAGFTYDSSTIDEVYSRILSQDIMVAMAAGNSYSAAYENGNMETNVNETRDPDNGVVSSPATYIGATTVASFDNTSEMLPYLVAGDDVKMAYNDNSVAKLTSLAGEPIEFVMVPNYGREKDYENINVRGKIAVVSRGGGESCTFFVKLSNAEKNGAAACLVYNNVDGAYINMLQTDEKTGEAVTIPNAFISQVDGARLKKLAEEGKNTITIQPEGVESTFPMVTAGEMSDFSSWGATPDLQLMPDVSAPGGQIYSTVDHGKYDTYGGTSMASPHVAGMSALVMQALRDKYPEVTGGDLHTAAEALIMSTAQPGKDPYGVLYSPRKQGAGYANVYSAVSSNVYLTSYQTATGELTPKASLGDDPGRTGVYTFSFKLNNLGNEPETFGLGGNLLTDDYILWNTTKLMSESERELTGSIKFAVSGSQNAEYDVNSDGWTDLADVQSLLDSVNGAAPVTGDMATDFDLNGDGVLDTADAQILYERITADQTETEKVTVPAKGTATVQVTVTLSPEDKAYMDENYPNGIYAEGFVRCYAYGEDGVDLSLPFMGFYGDWTDARVFEEGWRYEDNLSTQEEEVRYQRFPNTIFATYGENVTAGAWVLGVNSYLSEPYDVSHNVLSPNGDFYMDYVNTMYLGMMRGAKLVDFTWTNEAGEELFYEWYPYARKSFYLAGNDMDYPLVYDEMCAPFTMRDENGNLLVEDGDTLTLTIRAFLDYKNPITARDDHSGAPDTSNARVDETITVPVTIDLTKPTLDVDSLRFFTEKKGGKDHTYLSFTVKDNHEVAAVVPMTMANDPIGYVHVTNEDWLSTDGTMASTAMAADKSSTVTLDVTNYGGSFRIAVCDYGANESYYEVTNPTSSLQEDSFYTFRRAASPVIGGMLQTSSEYNGWHSFTSADTLKAHTNQFSSGETTVVAAEYVDGYVIAIDENSDIFAMKAGSWERIPIGNLGGAKGGTYSALDMAYDYTTDTMYVLLDELVQKSLFGTKFMDYSSLATLDLETGEIEIVGHFGEDCGLANPNLDPDTNTTRTQLLTLACDNEGILYGVDYDTSALYTIDIGEVEESGDHAGEHTLTVTSLGGGRIYGVSRYNQSMTVDHATDTLYWASYSGRAGSAYFFKLDKATGKALTATSVEYNSELTGLFKPYDSGREIFPQTDVSELELALSRESLLLAPGENATLTYSLRPFFGELPEDAVLTWSSEDETVAKVNDLGIVTAVGMGRTAVTLSAQVGETTLSASCTVDVTGISGTLLTYDAGYGATGDSWLVMDAKEPAKAARVTDSTVTGVLAATYQGGNVWAIVMNEETYGYDLVRMDMTLQTQGSAVPISGLGYDEDTESESSPVAMSFNYADNNFYVLKNVDYSSFVLGTLDPTTGELTDVVALTGESGGDEPIDPWLSVGRAALTAESVSLNLGEPYAMAIDYDGNFYFVGFDGTFDGLVLVRAVLEDGAWIESTSYPVETMASSMTWSEENGGLFLAADDSLLWIAAPGAEDEELYTISLGAIAAEDSGENLGLLAVVANEPPMPILPPTGGVMESSFLVTTGLTVQARVNPIPWNATCEVTYSIADESIATVDGKGLITGVSVGETTLTATVTNAVDAEGAPAEVVLTADVVVEEDPGQLFGFAMTGFTSQGALPMDKWASVPIAQPSMGASVGVTSAMTVHAGVYSPDGVIYAYGQSSKDYKYYLTEVDPVTYNARIIGPAQNYVIMDMAMDFNTGVIYAVGSSGAVDSGLFQVDVETGKFVLIKDFGEDLYGESLVGVAVDSTGQVFVVGTDGYFSAVMPGWRGGLELTPFGELGTVIDGYQSLTYDYNNDVFYWAKYDGYGASLVEVALGEDMWGDPAYVGTSRGLLDVDGGTDSYGTEMTALYTVPGEEVMPEIPETLDPTGVVLPATAMVVKGEPTSLAAAVLPITALAQVDDTLTWSVDDDTIATVDAATGVITGLQKGVVVVTAEDSVGNTAECAVTVLDAPRAFFGYDEKAKAWVKFDETGAVAQSWADARDAAAIVASAYVTDEDLNGTLYSYDADGYFYTVDTETFTRTKVGKGISDVTVPLYVRDDLNSDEYTKESHFTVVDMTYSIDEEGALHLYAALQAFATGEIMDGFLCQLVELDLTDGSIKKVLVDGNMATLDGSTIRASNILWYRGNLYFVDGFTSGMLAKVDLSETHDAGEYPVQGYAIFGEYWGDYVGGRSFLYDALTDTIYAVRDKKTQYYELPEYRVSKSELCVIGLGNANAEILYELGKDTIINSLFIK